MSTNAFLVSAAVHASLVTALGVLPLLSDETLPAPDVAVLEAETLFLVPLPPPPGNRRASDGARVPHVALPVPPPQATAGSSHDAPEPDAQGPDEAFGTADDVCCIGDPNGVIGSAVSDLSTGLPLEPEHTWLVRIGGQLAAPRLVRRVDPVYPALAAAARATATVELEAEVDARGEVVRVAVTHGHPLFDAAAIEAVERWRYQPLLLNGVPTAFVLTVTVRFDLKH